LTTEINVIEKGKIPGGIKREVVNTLRDCYRQFGSKAPDRVEVQLIDREATMLDFIREEKFKLGITTGGEEGFLCCHDAWRGFPRIIICTEKLARLNKLARIGAIQHEAAHSALHGSLEYYIFLTSDNCHHRARIRGIDPPALEQALYFISIAVKDFEVTRFLANYDYLKYQFAFALEIMQPSEEDKAAWKLAKNNRQARFLCYTAALKPILSANPLLSLPKSKKIPLQQQVDLGRRVEMTIEHMEETEQRKLIQVASNIIQGLTNDTHQNVDLALYQSLELV